MNIGIYYKISIFLFQQAKVIKVFQKKTSISKKIVVPLRFYYTNKI